MYGAARRLRARCRSSHGDELGLAVKSLAAFVNSDSVALIQFATEAVDDGAALSFERSRSAEAGVRCNGYLAYGPDITAALRIMSINKSG